MTRWAAYWVAVFAFGAICGPPMIDKARLAMTAPQKQDIVTAKGDTFGNRQNTNGTNKLGWRCDFDPLVVVGDSVTYGVGVDESDIFTTILQRETGRTVLNLGVPGYDMPDIMKVAEEWRGADMVYCYCLNDFSMIPRGYDAERGLYRKFPRLLHQFRRVFGGTEGYLRGLMRDAPGMTVVIMPFRGPWAGYHVRSLEFARGLGGLEVAGFEEQDFIDGLHFSVSGHRKMAENLPRLTSIGYLVPPPSAPGIGRESFHGGRRESQD